MTEGIVVPHWSYEEIRRRADEFLERFHPTRSIPVPIEDILDTLLRVDIFPIYGLLSAFDVDAFTSSDLSTICVDEFIYMKRTNRYRFSLAHEAGHIWMHRDLYTSRTFDGTGQWRHFVDSVPEKQYSWLEWQANCFAGLVLVPAEHLRRLVDPEVARIRSSDISLEDNADFAWDLIARVVAAEFGVSQATLSIRLAKEKIPDTYMR